MIIQFKNYKLMNDEEIKMVYDWRNSDRIRSKMIHQDIIPFDNHVKWVNNLKTRDDVEYYIVNIDGIYIGTIDFTSIDFKEGIAEWGYYVNDNGIGYGALLQYLLINHFFENDKFKILFCRVLENNMTVYNNHKKNFGFVDDDKYSQIISDKDKVIKVFGLSLSKEQWPKYKNKLDKLLSKFFDIEKVQWEK